RYDDLARDVEPAGEEVRGAAAGDAHPQEPRSGKGAPGERECPELRARQQWRPGVCAACPRGEEAGLSPCSRPRAPPVTRQADDSSDTGETLSPDELARALRAVATELERDPALARRVAGAMRAPKVATPPEVADGALDVTDEQPSSPSPPARRAGKAFKPRL